MAIIIEYWFAEMSKVDKKQQCLLIGSDEATLHEGILARINILVLLRKGNPVAIRDQDSYAAIWERCARTDFRIHHSR